MSINTQPTSIQAEVAQQLQVAKDRLRGDAVAREYVNKHIASMPVVVGGTFISQYTDERDQKQAKEQLKDHALWVICLQSTMTSRSVSWQGLGALFQQWCQESLGRKWATKHAQATAKSFCDHLVSLGIVEAKPVLTPYTDTDGTIRNQKMLPITDATERLLESYELRLSMKASMVCKPLLNQPEDWTSATDGVCAGSGLVLIKNSNLSHNRVEQAVLDAVNKLQGVAFMIPDFLIMEAFNRIANHNSSIGTVEELRMYNEVIQYKGQRLYFPITLDQRGRMYYRGGLLTPQGVDFCKAAFQFADYMALGVDGWEGIAMHTAGILGFDKVSIDERLSMFQSWYDCNTFAGINTAADVKAKFAGAKEFQGLVAIKEAQRLFAHLDDNNEPDTFMSNLVCTQDGTCNGLQHMAAITGDRGTAEAVNCTAAKTSDLPTDIYNLVAEKAAELAKTGSVFDLIVKYGRDMAKNPVMITGYGAGEQTIEENTGKYLTKKEGTSKHGTECGKKYLEAIGQVASAVHNLTNVLKMNVDFARQQDQRVFNWTTADGFEVSTNYMDDEHMRIRAGKFNAKSRDLGKPVFDEIKTKGAMAPNFVHSIDSTHLRMTVVNCDHDLVTVHDQVGSHATTFKRTSIVIREQFAKVHEYNALENLVSNMKGGMCPQFTGDYKASEAINAPYIFS